MEEFAGKGIKTKVNGKEVLAGNKKLMEQFNVQFEECKEHTNGTIIHIALEGKYLGHIVINDEVKPDSKAAIDGLKELGVENIVMLTGDNDVPAQKVASELGIEKVYSEIAVKVHGALMYCIPEQDSQKLHEQKYHPFSVYCVPAETKNTVLTRVSSLHESCDVIVKKASELDSLIIKGAGRAEIIQKNQIFNTSLETLVQRTKGRKYRLLFLTPSVFKTAGKETGSFILSHCLKVL